MNFNALANILICFGLVMLVGILIKFVWPTLELERYALGALGGILLQSYLLNWWSR